MSDVKDNTIVKRLGGRKSTMTIVGLVVLLGGYVFCVKAGGDSATFLSFAGSVCLLSGVGFTGNVMEHKYDASKAIAASNAEQKAP